MRSVRVFLAAIVLLALACPITAIAVDNVPIDCAGKKVLLFKDTIATEDCGHVSSPDGRYTLGWTVDPKSPTAPPVDWKLWTEDREPFLNHYSFDPFEGAIYYSHDWLVDLREKKMLLLFADEPYFPGQSHGYFATAWGPGTQAPRACLVQYEGKWSTEKLWLVTFDQAGMHAVDLGARLEKTILPIVHERRPLEDITNYSISYPVETTGDEGNAFHQNPEVQFHGGGIEIPFNADIAHSQRADDLKLEVDGIVTIALPDGAVLGVSSATPRDDPFHDDPDLVRADRRLNEIYAQLMKKLPSPERTGLKNDQLEWISERDGDADSAGESAEDGDTKTDFRALRNQAYVKATQDRIHELEQRLKDASD